MEKTVFIRWCWRQPKEFLLSRFCLKLCLEGLVQRSSVHCAHQQKCQHYCTGKSSNDKKATLEHSENEHREIEKEPGWGFSDRMLDRIRNNLTSFVSSLCYMSAGIPSRLMNEMQKYMSTVDISKEKVNQSLNEVKSTQFEKPTAFDTSMTRVTVTDNSHSKLPTQSAKSKVSSGKDDHAFTKAMHDVNESIVSFYDRSAFVNSGPAQEVYTDRMHRKIPETVAAEEDFASSIFQSLWRTSRDVAEQLPEKKPPMKKDFVSKAKIDSRTRSLVNNLRKAKSAMSRLSRTEELCKHLRLYPDSRGVADRANIVPLLLKFSVMNDKALCGQANEALALMGYVRPVQARGMRILAIDGGGTRGVVAIEALRSIEKHCQCQVRDLFDYVCGVSTGALIAVLVFLYRLSLDEVEDLYKEFSQQMFTRNKFLGTGKLVWSHAFYDTEIWEKILKQQMGKKMMIDFARDPRTPKLSGVSCLINVRKMKNFLFRNYNLPPNVYSQYPGSCNCHLWEVVRASSAAPGYFDPYIHGDYVHQDGGLLTNNPTALALHESRLLWPSAEVQCVVSLGTGRHEPTLEIGTTKVPLKDKLSKIVDSATDTEAVHMTMQDLLPPGTYFRLNPYMSEEYMLDEIRSEKIEQMQHEAQMYLRKNEIKLERLTEQLLLEKRPDQKVVNWLKRTLKWV